MTPYIGSANAKLQNYIENYKDIDRDRAKELSLLQQKITAYEGIMRENQKEADRLAAETAALKKQHARDSGKVNYFNGETAQIEKMQCRVFAAEEELLIKDNAAVRLEARLKRLSSQVRYPQMIMSLS